jgi:hypothetical protein
MDDSGVCTTIMTIFNDDALNHTGRQVDRNVCIDEETHVQREKERKR